MYKKLIMAEEVKAAIMERVQSFNNFFMNRDWKGLSELYTEDCNLMPPNSPIVKGRDGVSQTLASVHAGGIDKLALELQDLKYSSGDLAAERGIFKMSVPDGTVVQQGKYVVIWQRIDGKWYLHNDLFNNDTQGPKSVQDEIKERNITWMQYFKLKDFKAVGDMYTEDCNILPSNGPIVQGRAEAVKMFSTVSQSGVDYIELHPADIAPMGENMVMDKGTFSMYNKEGVQFAVGKYIVVWSKVNGTWLMDYDAFNDGL